MLSTNITVYPYTLHLYIVGGVDCSLRTVYSDQQNRSQASLSYFQLQCGKRFFSLISPFWLVRKFTRSTDTDNTEDVSIYTGASREIVYRIDVMCKEEGTGNRHRLTMILLQFLFLVIQNTVLCFSLLRVVSCRTDKK
jgi:hypothetical protein